MSGVHRLLTRRDKRHQSDQSKVNHTPSFATPAFSPVMPFFFGHFVSGSRGVGNVRRRHGCGHKRGGSLESLRDMASALDVSRPFKRYRRRQTDVPQSAFPAIEVECPADRCRFWQSQSTPEYGELGPVFVAEEQKKKTDKEEDKKVS